MCPRQTFRAPQKTDSASFMPPRLMGCYGWIDSSCLPFHPLEGPRCQHPTITWGSCACDSAFAGERDPGAAFQGENMTHVSRDLFSKRGAAFLAFLDVALTFKGLHLRIFRPRHPTGLNRLYLDLTEGFQEWWRSISTNWS